jgi:hypothetical protein
VAANRLVGVAIESAWCGALGVEAADPPVQLVLRGTEIGEVPAGQELRAERPVEQLDLAGRGRAPGRRKRWADRKAELAALNVADGEGRLIADAVPMSR